MQGMKKQLVIGIVAILFIIGLSGCMQSGSVIGTWEDNKQQIWIFNNDSTYSFYSGEWDNGTYKYDTQQSNGIIIDPYSDVGIHIYRYEFSEDSKLKLVLLETGIHHNYGSKPDEWYYYDTDTIFFLDKRENYNSQ
jgi:hypothetical protein